MDREIELESEAGYGLGESYRLVIEDLHQSYLPGLIAGLDQVLQAYPVLYASRSGVGTVSGRCG